MARRSQKSERAGLSPKDRLRYQLIALGLVLVVALLITAAEKITGRPIWDELYAMTGLSGESSAPPAAEGETAVHFIDIGQGDAVLIEQDGEFCLIDAGIRDTQDDLIAYLEAVGATHLKLLVMTHPHSDHIGGMRQVLRSCTVDEVLLPDLDKAPMPTSATFTRVLETIGELGIPVATAAAGDSYPIGTGRLEVLAAGIKTDNYNDLSPVLRFVGAGLTFVDSGDGERGVEADVLAAGAVLSADLYKAAHHGSNTSNTQEYLEAISPSVIVISCGQGNSYGHPHREPMERFRAVGAEIYRTDLAGTVIVTGGPNGIEVKTTGARQEAA